MMEWRVALLLLLVFVGDGIVASTTTTGFLLTGPKNLLKGSLEKFCISLEDVQQLPRCTLDLLSIHGDVVYATAEKQMTDRNDCITISVPRIRVSSGRLRLRIHSEIGDPVEAAKEVSFLKADPIHVIETDKAWYTPGQLVRFRLLILDHMLYPITSKIIGIYVEDPTGITVSRWSNVTSPHGLHQLEVQLSKEPVQGLWRIVVEGKRGQRTFQDFEVREFVLPKFEVVIKPPSIIKYNANKDTSIKKISIDICATYSYGQPVRGTWTAKIDVTDRLRYYGWSREQPVKTNKILRTGILEATTGCYSLKLPSDQLGLHLHEGGMEKTISVSASVAEQGTGIEMNSTWSTVVSESKKELILDISSFSSKTFKTNLPYYGKIRVSTADDAPAPGVPVEVCAHPTFKTKRPQPVANTTSDDERILEWTLPEPETPVNGIKYCAVRVSNAKGFVSFELLAKQEELKDFNIKATALRSRRRRRWIRDRPKVKEDDYEEITQQQFTIKRMFSRSESFLNIAPPSNYPDPVACHSQQKVLPVKMYFTAEKETQFDIHYMVVSRGDLLLSGVKKVQFRPEVDSLNLISTHRFLNEEDEKLDTVTINATAKFVGSVDVDIQVAANYGPKIAILAYYVRDDREVITADLLIPFENCFPNPVELSWSAKQKQPGQKATMNLKSGAGSICGFAVVDRSVTFMRPDLQLSEAKIFKRLPDFQIDPRSHPYQVTPDWEYCLQKDINEVDAKTAQDENEDEDLRRRKRSYIPWSSFTSDMKDAMEAFDNTGLVVISNLDIETRPCEKGSGRNPFFRSGSMVWRRGGGDGRQEVFDSPMPMAATAIEGDLFNDSDLDEDYTGNMVDLDSAVSVRTYFPETWLWNLVTLGPKGELKESFELPHSVTTWVGRAMCVSESQGFGMTTGAAIEAFQPFFLELHLPYAGKRTEQLQVKVSVFNYVSSDLPIRLTLTPSEHYDLLSGSNTVHLCVPAKNNAVRQFKIDLKELGRHNVTVAAIIDENYPGACGPEFIPSGKDAVVKELLVQPEGFPIERVYSHMACPKDFDEDKTLTWDLSLPDDVVNGSARAWVSTVGDLMGPALQGLSGLVRLPLGCGEQNMILFTPNIYVIQYLEATNQLEDVVKEQAVEYMKSGYQRELTYRHNDGSYSAFGTSDPTGSLWLTAFVVKSFAAARRYIHIDDAELQLSVRWLLAKQLENGCFPMVGTVHHKDLKGGLSDLGDNLAPLTAYTLIGLLEMHSESPSATIAKILEDTLLCLKPESNESGEQQQDVYTTALTAYVLALANRTEESRKHMTWLMDRAQKDNSLMWWDKPGSGLALSVELSSYVLLTLVKLGSTEDLLPAQSIVRWLSKQRNSEGGFVSTQDTVVALQAIAAYASLVGTQVIDMEMLIVAGDFEQNVRIRETDRLVHRRIDLPSPLSSSVSVDSVGHGSGCAIVQATLRYNVHTPPPSAAFELSVVTEELTSATCSPHNITVCARYTLAESSNMALVEIAMVSGYQGSKPSLESLMRDGSSGVKRFEMKDDVIVLYFDQITGDEATCVSLAVHPAFEVNDAKDATIKIYDYYQPEHGRSISYHLPSGCDPEMDIDYEPLPPLPGIVDDGGLEAPAPPLALPLVEIDYIDAFRSEEEDEGIDAEEQMEQDIIQVPSNPLDEEQEQGQDQDEEEAFHADDPTSRSTSLPLGSDMDDPFDLDVPDGIEAPSSIAVLPDHARGCPRCLSQTPVDFETTYCHSTTAFFAESRGTRLRIVADVSLTPSKVNSTVQLYLEPHCQCRFLQGKRRRNVSVLGLPSLPHPPPPQKLVVGAELLIIDQSPKHLKLKSIRSKCNSVIP